jgi:hypothetical protein
MWHCSVGAIAPGRRADARTTSGEEAQRRHAVTDDTGWNDFGAYTNEECGASNEKSLPLLGLFARQFTRKYPALGKLAERVGFEPTVRFPAHTLSKRAP